MRIRPKIQLSAWQWHGPGHADNSDSIIDIVKKHPCDQCGIVRCVAEDGSIFYGIVTPGDWVIASLASTPSNPLYFICSEEEFAENYETMP